MDYFEQTGFVRDRAAMRVIHDLWPACSGSKATLISRASCRRWTASSRAAPRWYGRTSDRIRSMNTHEVSQLAWERMASAVEKVRQRLRRAAVALEQAQVP